jgi:hypothetical protein
MIQHIVLEVDGGAKLLTQLPGRERERERERDWSPIVPKSIFFPQG